MTDFINLTPHSIEVYPAVAFVGLEQVNPAILIADSVDVTQAIATYESKGVARIQTTTKELQAINGVPMVTTTYGEATGIPSGFYRDTKIIVSLPMQSMARASNHSLANAMVAPYQVVRSRSNRSIVLGCMGFTF